MKPATNRDERDAQRLHAWVGGWAEAPPPERTLARWMELGLIAPVSPEHFTTTDTGRALLARFPQHGAVLP